MKALVYEDYQKVILKEVPTPTIMEAGDVIVNINAISFSHQDYRAKNTPGNQTRKGITIGHEGIGTITAIGSDVKKFREGDQVIIKGITKCGQCSKCQTTNLQSCSKYGFWLSTRGNGLAADKVRIPMGDLNVCLANKNFSVANNLLLCDVILTAYENIVLPTLQHQNKSSIVLIGDSPINLVAMIFLLHLVPQIKFSVLGHHETKLNIFKKHGAHSTFNTKQTNVSDYGTYDVVVETVGNNRGTFMLAQQLMHFGSLLLVVGVFPKPVTLNLAALLSKNITIRTNILTMNHMEEVISLMEKHNLDFSFLFDKPCFKWNELEQGYKSNESNRDGFKTLIARANV